MQIHLGLHLDTLDPPKQHAVTLRLTREQAEFLVGEISHLLIQADDRRHEKITLGKNLPDTVMGLATVQSVAVPGEQ